MRVLLMHPDRDFDPGCSLQPRSDDVARDLAVDTVVDAMGGGDAFLRDMARSALLSSTASDVDTILYRQEVLTDVLNNTAAAREMYRVAVEALERRRVGPYFGLLSRYPGGILHGAVALLRMLVEMLRRLRAIADRYAGDLESRGLTTFAGTLRRELSDEFLAAVDRHLATLRLDGEVLLSATLGEFNQGTDYLLHERHGGRPAWLRWILGAAPDGYTFRIPDRDEAGARALSELRDRGLNRVANAVAQSAEHLLLFFGQIRTELAFYLGAVNLRERLEELGVPVVLPRPAARGSQALRFRELLDVAMALSARRGVVGNTVDAREKRLVVVTGPNQGGKSSFLRSVGLAQLMMQCGLFVAAESFEGDVCERVFTHYAREEDASTERGKLDEELSRMSEIVDAIGPDSMLLLNESFAATNEREGSEIARNVVGALVDARVRIVFVTHLYGFARELFERQEGDVLFLRAERFPDGTRTFRIVPGEPLPTSFGVDLFDRVFADANDGRAAPHGGADVAHVGDSRTVAPASPDSGTSRPAIS